MANTTTTNAAPAADSSQGPPIAALNDILLPEHINGYWLAPGWVLIITATLCLLLASWVIWRKSQRKYARRRAALRELDQWLQQQQEPLTSTHLSYLSTLMKRVVLSANTPRRDVANLHGDEWVRYLNSLVPGVFDNQSLQLLSSGQYQRNLPEAPPLHLLARQCHQWINRAYPKIQRGRRV